MTFTVDALGLEMLCDSLSDGVIVFRNECAAIVSEGACELLATPRAQLVGADADHVLAILGLPPVWNLRLRAGDAVSTAPAQGRALRLRWLMLPDPEGSSYALVVQDMRLSRALRVTEEELALRAHGNEFGRPRHALGGGAVLRYLAREVRRSHLDFEELSVLVAAAGSPERAAAVADAIARHLSGSQRVGACDPLERGGPAEGDVTVVDFPRSAMPVDHVLVVLPCTASSGRDAIALRLASACSGRGTLAFGGATLQIRTAARRNGGEPRDGARALLERALRELARARADLADATPLRRAA